MNPEKDTPKIDSHAAKSGIHPDKLRGYIAHQEAKPQKPDTSPNYPANLKAETPIEVKGLNDKQNVTEKQQGINCTYLGGVFDSALGKATDRIWLGQITQPSIGGAIGNPRLSIADRLVLTAVNRRLGQWGNYPGSISSPMEDVIKFADISPRDNFLTKDEIHQALGKELNGWARARLETIDDAYDCLVEATNNYKKYLKEETMPTEKE